MTEDGFIMSDEEEALTEALCLQANEIVALLVEKGRSYGDSWKARGGVGAYIVGIARKTDRLEHQVEPYGYDIFKAIEVTTHAGEPVRETLIDLVGYALLILVATWELPS